MPGQISRYQKRVSGPMLDRIDIHLDVPSVETQKLVSKNKKKSDSSAVIQKRVQSARDIQTKRFAKTNLPARLNSAKRTGKAGIKSNAEMSTRSVKKFCPLSSKCRTMMMSATASMNISARSYFKVIKIARTIADLDGKKNVLTNHLAEALQNRPQKEDCF